MLTQSPFRERDLDTCLAFLSSLPSSLPCLPCLQFLLPHLARLSKLRIVIWHAGQPWRSTVEASGECPRNTMLGSNCRRTCKKTFKDLWHRTSPKPPPAPLSQETPERRFPRNQFTSNHGRAQSESKNARRRGIVRRIVRRITHKFVGKNSQPVFEKMRDPHLSPRGAWLQNCGNMFERSQASL